METLERVLAEHAFFRDLGREHLQLLVGCARNQRFEAGQFIFREGGEAEHFYLIRHGKIALEIYAPGKGVINIQTLCEDDVLGWSWLIPPHHWRFDARAVEPTLVIALDGKCLRGKCEQDHDLGYELLKRFTHVVEQRLQATRVQLVEVYNAYSDICEGR